MKCLLGFNKCNFICRITEVKIDPVKIKKCQEAKEKRELNRQVKQTYEEIYSWLTYANASHSSLALSAHYGQGYIFVYN